LGDKEPKDKARDIASSNLSREVLVQAFHTAYSDITHLKVEDMAENYALGMNQCQSSYERTHRHLAGV